MSEKISHLNDRLTWALRSADMMEVRNLVAVGASLSPEIPLSKQAECLMRAVKGGDHAVELLDLLLGWGLNPSAVYSEIGEDYQQTVFIAAARAGRVDLMEKLAAAGADIHWRSPTGANAASFALPSLSAQDYVPDSSALREVREWLEARGVRVDADCSDSRRKLCWAASNPGSWPEVRALLDFGMGGSILSWTPFMMKVVEGTATVEDAGMVSADELSHTDCYSRTPFLLAVAAGRRDLAQVLLERGSDLRAAGWCGATALHLAARYDHLHMIDWLVDAGLPVDVLDEHHETPLREAVTSGNAEALKKLISLGADVTQTDNNKYQAIHETDTQEIIHLLLEAGADVNCLSGGGDWLLKDAARAGDVSLVEYLLARGAVVDLTSTGETALHSAVRSDSTECVQLLLEAGADINAMDVDGWTCLWGVKSPAMAELLLANGADPGLRDQCGGFPENWSLPVEVTRILRRHRTET